MAENSLISWTDHTMNFWMGCTKVSPACDGCYAEALMDFRYGKVRWGPHGERVRTVASNWRKPLKWQREQAKLWAEYDRLVTHCSNEDPRPDRPPPRDLFVFVNSLSDFFDNQVDSQWQCDAFEVMEATPDVTYLLLTKRPQNIWRIWFKAFSSRGWPKNIAIGTTVEDRLRLVNFYHLMDAARQIEKYAGNRPAFLFGSCEPLLEDLGDLTPYLGVDGLDWMITGGGTDQGPWKAPPLHPEWSRNVRDQTLAAGKVYHHKQNGEWAVAPSPCVSPIPPKYQEVGILHDGRTTWMDRVGKKAAGRLLDGREYNDRPGMVHG